jgi:hypothetical protein
MPLHNFRLLGIRGAREGVVKLKYISINAVAALAC